MQHSFPTFCESLLSKKKNKMKLETSDDDDGQTNECINQSINQMDWLINWIN